MAAVENDVDDKFDNFEQTCRCADVPGVAYAVSSNGDPCLVVNAVRTYGHTNTKTVT